MSTRHPQLLVIPQASKVRLIASVPNLEEAFFSEEADGEKPYSALMRLKKDDAAHKAIAALLDALADPTNSVPPGALEWSDITVLASAVKAFDAPPAPAVAAQ